MKVITRRSLILAAAALTLTTAQAQKRYDQG